MSKSKPDVLFNSVTNRIADILIPQDTEAFSLYFRLSGLVTVEIPDPKNNRKFGLLHGGKIYTIGEWARLCKFPEGSYRRLFGVLKNKYSLVIQRLGRAGYSLAIVDSYKPSKTFPQTTIDRYPWLLTNKQPVPKRLRRNKQQGCEELSNEVARNLATICQDLSNHPQDLSNLNGVNIPQLPLVSDSYKEQRAGDMTVDMTVNREGEIESKKTTPARSKSSKPRGQEQVQSILQIAKAIAQDASFSTKAVSTLEALCRDSDFTLPELKIAVKARTEAMDEFQLKNAGSALAANLLSDISEIRRQHKEAERIKAVLAESTAREQAKAAEELAAVLARDLAESELIEEVLPG